MRLKKIVLVGFKSFAEKTTLHFDAGITCIVGPNGCGKSNISDAFRWVLGEQSAKSLRGHKMPDVIFAGASQRKPLNFAEVSITLTDIQGALPIEYEEITITRRLHRSGESEYFINSNPVRLKDIHSLLFDSGIGRNTFSIFEQGKLDQVINYSPVERRFIFEEAAGIVRFLHRKQEAFKKLDQAELNLSRVNDIHREVEKNIAILHDQAEKAIVYKENQTRFEMLDKASFLLRWENCEKKIAENIEKQSTFQQQLEEALTHLSKQQEQLDHTKSLVQQNEKSWKEINEQQYQLRSTCEIQKNEFKSNEHRLHDNQQKAAKLKRELEDLHLTRQMRQETLKEMQVRRQKVEVDFEEIASKLNHQGSKVKQKEKEVLQLRQELQSKQQEHVKCMQRESALASEVKQLELRIENNQERLEQINRKIQLLTTEMDKSVLLIQEKKTLLQQVSEEVDVHKARMDHFEENLHAMHAEIENTHKEFEAHRKKNLEQQARYQVLLRMREDFEGFSDGSKKLMKESQNPESPLHAILKPLYEFLSPVPEAVEALSAAMRAYAQTLVVETAEQLKKVIAFAENHGILDYSLFCLEHIRKDAKSKKKKNPDLLGQVDQILVEHFLGDIEIWETHEIGLKAITDGLQCEGWTKQGGYIDQKGVFFKIKSNENQLFHRESELAVLEDEIAQQEIHLKNFEQTIHQKQQQKLFIQNERAEVDRQLRRMEMKLVEVNFGLQRSIADQEKYKNEQKQLENDLQECGTLIERQKADLKQKEDAHFAINQELAQMQDKQAFAEKELFSQEQALRIQQQDEKEKSQAHQTILEDKRRLHHQCHMLESKEQEHENQVHRIAEECEELENQKSTLNQLNKQLQESIKANVLRLDEISSQCKAAEEEAERLKLMLVAGEKEKTAKQTASTQIEMQLAHLKAQHEHMVLTANGLTEDLQEKYSLQIEELKALPLPKDRALEQIEKQMRALKQVLHEAGDVNLTAIEELEKHQLRFEFLSQQVADLSHTKQELVQMIAKLDAESRRLLRETFELIRSNFQKNFRILFNGGEADLEFVGGSDNILEAGIEISAKPPGKQMRSISLLSGGEKCLTAVALLFAIFEVKPAPFCILDEIDAPLDDTNIERFVNVVRHFVDRCQFLIITHNKRTMAISDVLFGVSMEEKGVSKLLSLEFSHESDPEAALV